MIRAHRMPNPKHACASGDVLTPPERAVTYQQAQLRSRTVEVKARAAKWGDVSRISKLLMTLKGTL